MTTKQVQLAINGGVKTINMNFSPYNTIGTEEVEAASAVVRSGVLSDFVGAPGENFLGGYYVKSFESDFKQKFSVDNAISVNSWTSGLIAAVGALGIAPGDEVLVTPWTMCASAIAILHWNAIPIFVDIEADTFCMDPTKIEEKITTRTKAILVVDIFGQSADMDPILAIAKKHHLKVISDCAQSPGAGYKGRLAGTMGDVGGFSFNYHKHIHTGEGGMIVTNDDVIAEKCQLIRNHAEAAIVNIPQADLTNMIGYNFRLGEIESAIGIKQLIKLDGAIYSRQKAAALLTENLKGIDGLTTPLTRDDCTHVYYFYAMKHNPDLTGVSRDSVYDALVAEGVPLISKRYQNLHMLPMFLEKQCYGTKHFPWSINESVDYSYGPGLCPVAERLDNEEFLGIFMCGSGFDDSEILMVGEAFKKVYSNLDELRQIG
jgi:dTDP-4-amino-4,6-dideoxygalactose transaminase